MKLNDKTVLERMAHHNVFGASIALIGNSEIISTKAFGLLNSETKDKVTADTLFNACSISKFIAATLVLILSDKGTVDLDEDINVNLKSWKVPEYEWTQNKKVTLRTLLSHQSGILDPQNSFEELDSVRGKRPTMKEILEGVTPYCPKHIDLKYAPGTHFEYSDAGFCLIEQLLEDRTGKPYTQLVQEIIFDPLMIKNSTFDEQMIKNKKNQAASGYNKNGIRVKDGYPIYPYPAAAGLWSTPTDLALLVIDIMQSLLGISKIGLSKKTAEDMISPQGCSKWTGLGLFLDNTERKIEISSLGWGIGFQCIMIAYPHLGTGAVIMTNTDLGVHQMKGFIGDIYQSLDPQITIK